MKSYVIAVALAVSAIAQGRADESRSTALEASHIARVGRGLALQIEVYSTAGQYILIFDSATVPPNGTAPTLKVPIKVPADGNVSYAFKLPVPFVNGLVICNSSTAATKTEGSATCWFTTQTTQ